MRRWRVATLHVACFAADESLVRFNFAAKRSGNILVHCLADAVHHEPRRLLSNADSPSYLAGTNSVPTVADHPERTHPLVQAQRRIFEDSSNLERELLLAPRAKPDAPRLDEGVLLGATAGARNHTIRPAKIQRILKAAVGIAEVNHGILKCLWRVHGLNLRRIAMCVKYIIALIWKSLTLSSRFSI
jgi:hypothetical protein